MKASLTQRSWADLRNEFEALAPEFTKIVDQINPGPAFRLYEVSYPYGSEIVAHGMLHLPDNEGNLYPLSSERIDKQIQEDLNYNLGSNPCAFVFENCVEAYTHFDDRVIPLCDFIGAGSFSGTWQVLAPQLSHYPEFLWSMSAGARSIFMLSKISEAAANNRLKRAFSLSHNKPKTMMEHWQVFREIAAHPDFPTPWRTRMVFFSGEWFKHLNDPAFSELHRFLLKAAWRSSEFWRTQFVWNLVFSSIQKNRQIKASAHIVNTVQHLLITAAGFAPGFSPAIDDSVAPIHALQQIYIDIYGLKNYAPIIMQPLQMDLNKPTRPVYYSLHYPTATTFSPKSSSHTSTISDLYEVKMVMRKYLLEMHDSNIDLSNTVIEEAAHRARFEYFHSDIELYHDMRPSCDIPKEDDSFKKATPKNSPSKEFPNNASFVRGCIRVSLADQTE